jgi:DNA-binding SARP family transcriptional activator
MEFGILGPVTAAQAGRAVQLGGARNQAVLAALLIGAGRVVSAAELAGIAWDEPPATARQQLRTVVHRLRQILPTVPVRTVAAGYRLDLDGHQLDAEAFTAGVALARRHLASGRPTDGVEAFRDALGLWRGPALAGLDGVAMRTHATGLDELRLAAIAECAEAELRLGRHRRLVPELHRLTAEHPLRESFAALLMTALARDGRRPEAIQVYHELAGRLRDELGIDPGPVVRAAYLEAIDNIEPPPTLAVRYLPQAPLRLIGRDQELASLLDLVCGAQPASVVVLDGMAGIGKTALALKTTEALTERYPDGHLYIDLHGHSDQQPVTGHEALHTLLRQLHIDPADIPDGGPERAALWRQRLDGRRSVVLLDNAASSTQIELLLPPDRGSLVLVTSRVQISSIDSAAAISLDVLSPGDAVELLRHAADQRVDEDFEAAAAITELCGRLPLAIRLAGHRLRQRHGWTVAMLQEQLGTARQAPLTVSVEGRSTAAAFDLSYRNLPVAQQQLFRRLGLHPAGTVEAWAAAALADVPVQTAVELLDGLVEANLVHADRPGRYRLHDLIHTYAESLVGDDERGPATVRMLDEYLNALATASGHLDSIAFWPTSMMAPAPREASRPAFQPAADDAGWALTNWSTIVALIHTAERAGTHRHTALLVRLAGRTADVAGRSGDALRLAEQALAAADALGDDDLAASTYRMVGSLYLRLGRHTECRISLERALRLHERRGDALGIHLVRFNTITLLRHEGRHDEALELTEKMLAQLQGVDDDRLLHQAMATGAHVLHELERHDEAHRMLTATLSPVRPHIYPLSIRLGLVGSINLARGHQGAAAVALLWAIRLSQSSGDVGGAAEALSDYGRVLAAQGELAAALRCQQRAYEQACALPDGYFVPTVANHLGATLTLLGRYDEALDLHRRALREAEQRHRPYEQTRANAGIAAALQGQISGAES